MLRQTVLQRLNVALFGMTAKQWRDQERLMHRSGKYRNLSFGRKLNYYITIIVFYLEVVMEAVIQRWGSDFGVRIPMGIAQKLSLKTGYKVFIVPMESKPTYELETLLASVNKSNLHKEISFGKTKGKEQW
jgi:antitoxin component of MazEF toxin-antitoxin module